MIHKLVDAARMAHTALKEEGMGDLETTVNLGAALAPFDGNTLTINTSDIGDNTLDVARIILQKPDGTRAIFFVDARVKNGKPALVVTAKKRDAAETVKTVTAQWKARGVIL